MTHDNLGRDGIFHVLDQPKGDMTTIRGRNTSQVTGNTGRGLLAVPHADETSQQPAIALFSQDGLHLIHTQHIRNNIYSGVTLLRRSRMEQRANPAKLVPTYSMRESRIQEIPMKYRKYLGNRAIDQHAIGTSRLLVASIGKGNINRHKGLNKQTLSLFPRPPSPKQPSLKGLIQNSE